ncbi:MAG: hypothetical protein Q4E18_00200 [Clostridia bacterium]|nr:hypothetical protein [Clostridia bacterium]
MILTVEEYKALNPTDAQTDSALGLKLRALESAIRAWTNNNFQKRGFRFACPIYSGKLSFATNYISVGDTVQISDSAFNDGVYDVTAKGTDEITLNETLYDEDYVLVTKVVYPPDVKMGVVNLMKWDNEKRDKIGIASETLSRHSVSYSDMTGENAVLNYPKSLLGFLTPYMKVRF